MKKIILSVMCCLLVIGFTSGCSNNKNNESSKYMKPITYIEDNNWNIVDLTTPDENGIIKSIEGRPFYLIAVENNEIVDAVILDDDYKVENNNNKYYKISVLEFYMNCESSLNYNGKDSKYNIKLLMSVSDPVKFFETSNIISTDTSNNLFGGYTSKDLFNNSLKGELENNLNEIIIEYLEENNLDFSPSIDLGNYISNSLDELLRNSTGIKIVDVNLNLI